MNRLLNNYFKLIKKIISGQKQEVSIGLDVGNGECKLVEIVRDNDSYRLLNWAVEPVIEGDIRTALQKILKKSKYHVSTLHTAVLGRGTLIRYVDMPQMSTAELENSFSIEADKYFPFVHDQIYADCYILDKKAKGSRMNVLAVAAKRELIDHRIKLLIELGYQVDFVGINSIALTNVIYSLGPGFNKEKDSAVAIFDMGDTVSNLTILVNRLPRFTRDIFIGGRDFTKSISNAMGVSFAEAEKIKCNPQEKLDQVVRACEAAMGNIAQELRLSFDYFSTENDREVAQLLLTGGTSRLEKTTKVFENTLDVPLGYFNPLEKLEISPDLAKKELETNADKLAVTIGLALYQYA